MMTAAVGQLSANCVERLPGLIQEIWHRFDQPAAGVPVPSLSDPLVDLRRTCVFLPRIYGKNPPLDLPYDICQQGIRGVL